MSGRESLRKAARILLGKMTKPSSVRKAFGPAVLITLGPKGVFVAAGGNETIVTLTLLPREAKVVRDALKVVFRQEGVARLRAEHVEIADLVARLAAALDVGEDPREPMAEIGWLVHDHVRYEERALFEGAQARLSADALAGVGRALAAHRSARGLAPGCPTRTA